MYQIQAVEPCHAKTSLKFFIVIIPKEHPLHFSLRLPDTYASKIAKICDLKKLSPLFGVGSLRTIVQKGFLSDFEKLLY